MSGPLTIRILGAGVAGLTTATLLARDGHRVHLYDEAFALPSLGTSLGLFGPAHRVLDSVGVLERIREVSSAPRSGVVRGARGQVIARIPAGGALLVARTDLVRHLMQALPGSVHRHRLRVTDVRPLRAEADLLIGADGVHSLVRRSGWGHRAGVVPAGRTVLRGTAPIPPPEISETWDPRFLFGITPLADGGTNWFAAVPEHRSPSVDAALDHLRGIAQGRSPAIDAVLAAAAPGHTVVHGITTVRGLLPVRESVVLIGDAAHAMAPNLGHGANTALVDAEVLAACLRRSSTVRSALVAYAARRNLPDQAWRIGSTAMLELGTARRGAALRDRALASALGRRAQQDDPAGS